MLEDRQDNPRDPLSFKGGWNNNIDEKGTSEEQRVYRETVWKDLCRERMYQPGFFRMLFINNIHLITGIKKNMQNSLMNLYDKLLIRKRYPVETIDDELKNVCQIEYIRQGQ